LATLSGPRQESITKKIIVGVLVSVLASLLLFYVVEEGLARA
jgi:hypothetical protein